MDWMATEASHRLEVALERLEGALKNEAEALARVSELEAALLKASEERAKIERDRGEAWGKVQVTEEKYSEALSRNEAMEAQLGKAMRRAENAKESEEGQRWHDEINATEIWDAMDEIMAYTNQETEGKINWNGCRWYNEETGRNEESGADQEEATNVDLEAVKD